MPIGFVSMTSLKYRLLFKRSLAITIYVDSSWSMTNGKNEKKRKTIERIGNKVHGEYSMDLKFNASNLCKYKFCLIQKRFFWFDITPPTFSYSCH